MKSKEFIGVMGVNKNTPHGGLVRVAFGDIIAEDDSKFPAIAVHIEDSEGTIVTQFALQPESFGVLIEAIKELYDGALKDEQSV